MINSAQISNEMLEEGTHFEVVKDGTGYGYKYAILDHICWCPKEGIVEIRRMKNNLTADGKQKNDDEVIIKRFKDRATGLLFGLHNGVDDRTKQINHTYAKLDGNMMFDLSIASDRRLYIMAMYGPSVHGSPNQAGKPTYKVYDKQIIASMSIDKRSLRRKAEDIINSLKGNALEDMARDIGVNVEANRNPSMLLDEVYRISEGDPRKFIEIYESKDREYITIFNRAISKGIIKLDYATNTFSYGGIPLGYSKEAAINYLVEKSSTASAIKIQCDDVDKGTSKSMAFVKNDISELEALRAELAELKKNKSVDGPQLETPKDNVLSPEKEELDSLRARAKELKIHGSHLASKETLLKKILEAEEK